MASTRRFKGKDGERKEETTWAKVTAYNGVASGIVDYLTKGKEVTVVGRVRTFEYDKEGVTHYGWEIVAEEVVLGAGGRRDDEDEDEKPARKSSKSSASKSKSSSRSSSRRSRDEDVDDDDDEDNGEAPW